jgi:hypothetical protein
MANQNVETLAIDRDYWIGPYGVFVPGYLNYIIDKDGVNYLYKDGKRTEAYVSREERPTKEEWLNRYTIKDSTGNYWYRDNEK